MCRSWERDFDRHTLTRDENVFGLQIPKPQKIYVVFWFRRIYPFEQPTHCRAETCVLAEYTQCTVYFGFVEFPLKARTEGD